MSPRSRVTVGFAEIEARRLSKLEARKLQKLLRQKQTESHLSPVAVLSFARQIIDGTTIQLPGVKNTRPLSDYIRADLDGNIVRITSTSTH